MPLDPRFITTSDLSPYLVDKDTGYPLANGTIEFWKDNARSVPKTVYELTGSPPNYTYTALPNPVTLSSVGTIEDSLGNNVALYYFPYASMADGADIELYYVVVKNEAGEIQFTREAWPNLTPESSPVDEQNNVIINQLSNPQFVDVLFEPNSTLSISFTGSSTTTVSIAPDWDLVIAHTGSGSVTVTRTAVAGSSQYPTNPPYTMTFVGNANVSSLKLRQRLTHNPNIWSPASGGSNGYIGANIVLEANSSVIMYYAPSSGAQQQILSETNGTGTPFEYSTVTQLSAASNPNTADTGYVDIIIQLPATGTTTLTSVQVVGLETEDTGIRFNQAPVNRQEDQLFHHYNPLLQAKTQDSYLVGWDFPVNPAQLLGSTVSAFATGADTSNYVWDQTICFQTADSGVSFSRPNNQSLRITAGSATQFALIQYLDFTLARQILNGRNSVNLSATTSKLAGIGGTISLWYTKDASLPNMGANTSLVSALDSNGFPTAGNGTWVQVPRSNLGNAAFHVEHSLTENFNDYGFSGWDLAGAADASLATFFAIVVGFEALATSDTVDVNSISLVPGDIPCQPNRKSANETLMLCERFYTKSYESSTLPGTVSSVGVKACMQTSTTTTPGGDVIGLPGTFEVVFRTPLRTASYNVTLYSDASGDAGKLSFHGYYNGTSKGPVEATLASSWAQVGKSTKSVGYYGVGASLLSNTVGSATTWYPMQTWITFHYVCDARLGIV